LADIGAFLIDITMKNIQNFDILSSIMNNKDTWDNRKLVSEIVADHRTDFFKKDVLPFVVNGTKEDKIRAERIIKASIKQQNCSESVEYLHATTGESGFKRLLSAERCNSRKTCPICASIAGRETAQKLLSYFKDINKNKNVVCYPVTISPENFNTVEEAWHNIDSILKKFYEATRKTDKKKRGNAESKQAISQLKERMEGAYLTIEVEPSKSQEGKINMHIHGLLFVDYHKSFKETLNYESMREFFIWCNGGNPVSNHIGDTKNNFKPITMRQKDYEKAIYEVTKYVTKISTKTNAIDSEEIYKKQALIWEVYASTHNRRFIRTYGSLNNYELEIEFDERVPDKIVIQELKDFKEKYKQKVTTLHEDYKKLCWFECIKLENKKIELENTEQKLDMVLNDMVRGNKRFLEIRIKAIKTTIRNLEERIMTTVMYSEHKRERKEKVVPDLFIEYQDKYKGVESFDIEEVYKWQNLKIQKKDLESIGTSPPSPTRGAPEKP